MLHLCTQSFSQPGAKDARACHKQSADELMEHGDTDKLAQQGHPAHQKEKDTPRADICATHAADEQMN